MRRVFLTNTIPASGIHLLKRAGYRVERGPLKKAKGADALLCLLTDRINGKIMDAVGAQLKVISNYAVGLDNVDLQAAKKRKIVVTNTPDVLTETVAEHTLALILALARRIREADRFVRIGRYKGFDPNLFLGTELQGKILGIVGCGRIGLEVARKMYTAFGMRVCYYDQAPREEAEKTCGAFPVSLIRLLKESDVVSLHVPLLPSTKHLIGEKELGLMKKTAYLVNTARGAVVDEKALVKALQEGKIAGAALDVFEEEPKLTSGLAKLENVLLTPHIASATKEARERMAVLAAQNIIDVLK